MDAICGLMAACAHKHKRRPWDCASDHVAFFCLFFFHLNGTNNDNNNHFAGPGGFNIIVIIYLVVCALLLHGCCCFSYMFLVFPYFSIQFIALQFLRMRPSFGSGALIRDGWLCLLLGRSQRQHFFFHYYYYYLAYMEMERVRWVCVSAVPHVCLMVDRSLHQFGVLCPVWCEYTRARLVRSLARSPQLSQLADIVPAYRLPMGTSETDAQKPDCALRPNAIRPERVWNCCLRHNFGARPRVLCVSWFGFGIKWCTPCIFLFIRECCWFAHKPFLFGGINFCGYIFLESIFLFFFLMLMEESQISVRWKWRSDTVTFFSSSNFVSEMWAGKRRSFFFLWNVFFQLLCMFVCILHMARQSTPARKANKWALNPFNCLQYISFPHYYYVFYDFDIWRFGYLLFILNIAHFFLERHISFG